LKQRRRTLKPLNRLVVVSPLVTLPPPVRLHLRLSSHRHLSSHPSCASCLSGFCVASCHAATSRLPAPPPLIAPPPLTVPLWRLLSSWLSHHFSSCRHLPSACASTSHCTPLAPLVRLVVASGTMPPPPIACASASHCAPASHHTPLAPLVLLVPPPLITPLSRLLSGWLLRHLSSCRRLLSACAFATTNRCPPRNFLQAVGMIAKPNFVYDARPATTRSTS
jgi:hypothetical protein